LRLLRHGGVIVIVGYARTSTIEQQASVEAQEADLRALGCEKIFAEQVSSVASRPQLEAALEFVREGDVLVVKSLDRLARSVIHMLQIQARLEAKSCSLRILDMNLDTSTSTGRFFLQIMGSVAEFERAMMLERQKIGIAKAKAAGKYKGRKPTARSKKVEVQRMWHLGMGPGAIAKSLGISRSSVYRCLG
jgi:DNA invertase Pin-like site-specific DNA recombinase